MFNDQTRSVTLRNTYIMTCFRESHRSLRPVLQNPPVQPLQSPALQNISSFCEESRCRNQWVPSLELQDR